jgi:hypothetical protein
LQIKKETSIQTNMPRRKRTASLAQKWMSTNLTETVSTLTTTVTALELTASCSSPTTSDSPDFPIDDHSSIEDDEANLTETDEESDKEAAVPNPSTTVTQCVQMQCGINKSVLDDDESNVTLTAMDCATLDVLKLCHDGGCTSLEFFDNL